MSSNLKVNTILPSTGTAIGIGTASGNVDVLGHIVGHNTPNISGINSVTATTFYGSGANLTSLPAANLTGTLPAISGANLTGLVSLSGSTNNTVATVTGANALIGEGNLKFDGTNLGVGGDPTGVSNYSTLHLKGPSSGNGGAIRLQDHGDTPDSDDFTIYKNSSAGYLRINGTDPLISYMNGAERLKIESDGDTTISTGNLVIGTSGKGIDFSATGAASGAQAANQDQIFDDYESGTFSPLLKRLMANGTTETGYYTQNTRQGFYTKVGSRVFCTGRIHWNGGSTGSGSLLLVNLPYTPKSGGSAIGANEVPLVVGYRSGLQYPRITGYLQYGNSRFFVQFVDGSGNFGSYNISPSATQSSGHLYFSFNYEAQ